MRKKPPAKSKPRLRELRAGDLVPVAWRSQPPQRGTFAHYGAWDPSQCLPLAVSLRDGRLEVFDGLIRAALACKHSPDTLVWCDVWEDLSEQDEREFFVKWNARRTTT